MVSPANAVKRSFDGASRGRRTSGWRRHSTDPNAALVGQIDQLRFVSRDMQRNNPWAAKGTRIIVNNTVGTGIRPRSTNKELMTEFLTWANSKKCDARGKHDLWGLQRLYLRAVVNDGESIVRIYPTVDPLCPFKLQVLEADHIDTDKHGDNIVQGIEYDEFGGPVAIWLFPVHPGNERHYSGKSERVSYEFVIHGLREDRPGQKRGISWFAPVVTRFKHFQSYEDALLERQRISACYVAFVTQLEGETGPAIGEADEGNEMNFFLQPGAIEELPAGKDVKFASPPAIPDNETFSRTQLRGMAAGLGVTYEDLTGDYTDGNFSNIRMSRLSHWESVKETRADVMVIPFCSKVWDMFSVLSAFSALDDSPPEWVGPPMPVIDPKEEGAATTHALRSGQTTLRKVMLERGADPDQHYTELAEGMKTLADLGIVLDSDPSKTTQSGQLQITIDNSQKKGSE